MTVRDLSVELKDDAGETELLRNYEFNISQGIVQRVSRFFDALALMDEAQPARGEGGKYADSARGGVMGFGRKRNVCNQEKSTQDAKVAALKVQVAVKSEKERSQKQVEEAAAAAAYKAAEQDAAAAEAAAAAARKVAEQSAEVATLKEEVAALKAAEQDTKMAALEAQVAAAAAVKAAEQDKMAALETKVAELQALAATSIALRPISVEH